MYVLKDFLTNVYIRDIGRRVGEEFREVGP